MPRRKGKKLTVKKSSPKKSSLNASKSMDKDSFNSMKTWLDAIKKNNSDFQYNTELMEINTDSESDEFECNLKELEVRIIRFMLNFCITNLSLLF